MGEPGIFAEEGRLIRPGRIPAIQGDNHGNNHLHQSGTQPPAPRSDLQPGPPAWKEPASPLYRRIKAVILGLITLSIMIPILLVVSTSLADDKQLVAAGGYVLWPTNPTWIPTRPSSAASS